MLDSWNFCMEKKGLEIYGWCIMPSHIHLIIGTHGDKMEYIMRDMKRHTSEELRKVISNHPGESRREWLLEMMETAGKNNPNNIGFQLWQQHNNPIELFDSKIAWQKFKLHTRKSCESRICRKAGRMAIQQRKKLLWNEGFN
jgi:REP element-mobilizing transposase RayT